MTDTAKFRAVLKSHDKKIWEVAAGLGMSPQALYNKIGNATQFTQSELAKFRELFPDVTDEQFNEIFFAVKVAATVNE